MKIAVVYDWIDKWGGVERVLLTLHEILPDADFYTSYYDKRQAPWAEKLNIKTSFINKFPNFIKTNRLLSLPLYLFAFESFNLNDYDVVISVTSSFAKAVITGTTTFHICYLLTPTRFLWSHEDSYMGKLKTAMRPYSNYLKNWDKTVAQRPDKIISISQTVADRCRKYYGRESDVIYPPFDKEYWNDIKSKINNPASTAKRGEQKYFLVVSRLEKYKKVDLVVKTFNQLNQNLVIVGKGSQEKGLRQIAKNNIQFVKDITDEELGFLYSKAQVLIMPQEEDFGYVSLEAQFFGCPVIYYGKGGATETVIEDKTGISFDNQTVESLTDALERFGAISYNLRISTANLGRQNIEKYAKSEFEKRLTKVIISNF